MTVLMLLLLLVYSASAEKHSMSFHLILSFGIPTVPEYTATESLDDVTMSYYDSSMETGKPLQEWVEEKINHDPQRWETQVQNCIHYHQAFKVEALSFKQPSNQTEGVHVIQQISGCEWDDETEKVDVFKKYANNGEDFLSLDMETETWISLKPDAEITKQEWDQHKAEVKHWKNLLTSDCLQWLKTSLNFSKSFLQRKDLPSVSLLQKTPSSPVTCHATGFHPDRAVMFWRRDGEEVDEGVEHGELLPNPDGTFQMSLHLNISSVSAEDWSRYDCVFQLSGVQSDIVTKLDPTRIRSNLRNNRNINHKENHPKMSPPIIGGLVILSVVVVTVVGFILYKKKKDQQLARCPENLPELSERLKPDPETRSTNPS